MPLSLLLLSYQVLEFLVDFGVDLVLLILVLVDEPLSEHVFDLVEKESANTEQGRYRELESVGHESPDLCRFQVELGGGARVPEHQKAGDNGEEEAENQHVDDDGQEEVVVVVINLNVFEFLLFDYLHLLLDVVRLKILALVDFVEQIAEF